MAARRAIWPALALSLLAGCGEGLYEPRWLAARDDAGRDRRGDAPEAAAPADAPPADEPGADGSAGADAAPPDVTTADAEGPRSACERLDFAGGEVALAAEARLTIPTNALRMPTEVCLVRVKPARARGALDDRAYDVTLTGGTGRFVQPPVLELRGVSAPAGISFSRLSLAYLQFAMDGTSTWIAIQDGRMTDAARTIVSARVVQESSERRYHVAPVVSCDTGGCPASFNFCSGAACQ